MTKKIKEKKLKSKYTLVKWVLHKKECERGENCKKSVRYKKKNERENKNKIKLDKKTMWNEKTKI